MASQTFVLPCSSEPDFDTAEAILGRAVDRSRVTEAPTLWTRGRPELEVCAYLRWAAPAWSPDRRMNVARDLARWVAFLDERGKRVGEARAADYRYYEVAHLNPRQVDGSRTKPTTAGRWRNIRGAISGLYDWAADTYAWSNPVPVRHDPHTGRKSYGGRRLVSSAPDVMPLTPREFALLLDAAHRPTAKGGERVGAARDAAQMAWMVATGQRTHTAIHQTHYELPPPSIESLPPMVVAEDLTDDGEEGTYVLEATKQTMERVRTAAAITKTNRAVLHLGLSGWLNEVRDYAVGTRDLLLREYRPRNPLLVQEANAVKVVFTHASTGEVERRAWSMMTADERLRLVDPDGSTAMLFVQQTGRPWKKGSARNAITAAVREAERHAGERGQQFPVGVHPHSLRHTYAVWIAMLRVMRDEEAGFAHLDMSRKEIVEYTARQMGHAPPGNRQGVTDLYLSFLDEFMLDRSITPSQLKGFDR